MNFIEDVVSCFQDLKSYERILMMCRLQHCCLPFELRFLGTCLEDLGKRDFYEFKKSEIEANDITELDKQDLSKIRNRDVQKKLIIYLSLLHTYNYNCSSDLYRILTNVEEVYAVLRTRSVDLSESLERLFMIYTLAINHPAFTTEQKKILRNIFSTIQLEQSKCLQRSKTTVATNRDNQGYNNSVQTMYKATLEAGSEQFQSEQHMLENTSQCFTVIPPYPGDVSVPLQNQLNVGINAPNFIRYAFPVNSSSQLVTTAWPTGMPVTFAASDSSGITSNTSASSAYSSSAPSKSETSSRCTSPNITIARPLSAPQNKTSAYSTAIYESTSNPNQSLVEDDSNVLTDFSSYSSEQTASLADEEYTDARYDEDNCTVNKIPNSTSSESSSLIDNKASEYSSILPITYIRKFPNGTIPVTGIYFAPQLPTQIDNVSTSAIQLLCTPTNPCQYCVSQQNNQVNGLVDGTTSDMRLLTLDSDVQNGNSISSNSDSGSLDNSPCSTPTVSSHEKHNKEIRVDKWSDQDEYSGSKSAPEESTSYDEICMPPPPPVPPSNTSSFRRRGKMYSRNYAGIAHNYTSGKSGNPDSRQHADISLSGSNSSSEGPAKRSYSSSSDSLFSFPSNNGHLLLTSNGSILPSDNAAVTYVHPQYYQRSYPPFTAASYIRPTYPFVATSSNTDVLYRGYSHQPLVVTAAGPTMIPVQNPVVCSENIPRKTFCCNCGSQSHIMEDCPEPTMEDSSRQNMYHIDFSQSTAENIFIEGNKPTNL